MYWSSLIQEERLAVINQRLEVLQKEVKQKKADSSGISDTKKQKKNQKRPHIDPKYKNMLEVDPFFTETMPKLLGPNFVPKGTFRLATIGSPQNLHPFSQWLQVSEWTGYCEGQVASQKFGFYERMSQDFAIKMEQRKTDRPDRVAFWVHLRDDLMWQPLEQRHFPDEMALSGHFLKKTPVTAHDFQFFWDALSNTHVDVPDAVTLRFLLRDIDKLEVIDDLTFVVTCKLTQTLDENDQSVLSLPYAVPFYVSQLRPLARFVYQYNHDGTKICPDDAGPDFYRTSSTWAQSFASHFASRVIVSCGAWIFDGIDDRQIRFRKNGDYYSQVQALYEAMEIYFLETTEALFRDFLTQKIDLCILNPQSLVELDRFLESPEYKEQNSQGNSIRRLDFLQRSYTYVGWNEKRELFANKKTRQALTYAIDRGRLIRQNLNGQGVEITGPSFYGSSEYDTLLAPYPFDPDKAKLMLAEEGWYDSEGDGILHKVINGKKEAFSFTLAYFVKNAIAKINCELIAQSLKEIGIDCRLNGMDLADLSAAFEEKNFDALYLAWSLGAPPEDPRQLWHSEGAQVKGSSNMIGFQNVQLDRVIEKLQFEKDPSVRKELYRKLHGIIYDEQPYTFLFSPTNTLIWWSYIQNIFIPKERQDLVPGAQVEQPVYMYSWTVK
ncbi:MAG: ABC transporter substrate-binding protein [Chlamydiales bacterium]|nr:ABC transporter substrate-binding protein [Chlamydiales bacterium]